MGTSFNPRAPEQEGGQQPRLPPIQIVLCLRCHLRPALPHMLHLRFVWDLLAQGDLGGLEERLEDLGHLF